ncbi:MAG: F0F1 ATP synthase subunit A [Chloroflexi bacterium]|jgi:F-type H+-transporting ATPase subunit a|nr:F0F1 ATP synthase subunit A [Chloroflexota bacterium]
MKRVVTVLVVLVLIGLCAFSCVIGPLGQKWVVQPHVQMAAETFPIGPVRVPNSLMGMLLAGLVLIGLFAAGTRHIRAGRPEAMVPRGLQNLVEAIYEFLANFLRGILGERSEKMLPLLITFFLFILVANWVKLIPGFETIGLIEHAHKGEGHAVRQVGPLLFLTHEKGKYTLIPILRAANTDLNVPLALALISVFMTQVYGVQALGWGYFSRFINIKALTSGGLMGVMNFLVGLLETLSEFTKIISFGFRLFGNIFAGMVLLVVIPSLVPFVAPVAFYILELFVGAVQALVFMMLTAAFTAVATAGHGEHH